MAAKTEAGRVVIGNHYTDALAGLVVYRDAAQSVLLSVGWAGADGEFTQGYYGLLKGKVRFGEAAPDDSYHRILWTVDNATVTFEWGLVREDCAVGRVTSTGDLTVFTRFGPGWPGSNPTAVTDEMPLALRAGDLTVAFHAIGAPSSTRVGSAETGPAYSVGPHCALQFSIGVGTLTHPEQAGDLLDAAREKYRATRLWAEGDWGDFLSPIQNQLGNSKIYSIDTGRLAHIVTRGWCTPDGQILFCWDSFFNGLMASLEDPEGGRDTVRAMLAEATPDGLIPNITGRGSEKSSDRSQPPVGSTCVWKMHLRAPDLEFLREVYPQLLKWHRWWVAPNAPGGRPNRDGNGNGLLEWGSATGILQNGKWESGLDDSPMFEDGAMEGPHMTMDATDLSALWAMDAEYLARIAEAIGNVEDASQLRSERERMSRRIDELMWNDSLRAYCYRYWTPNPEGETFSSRLSPLNFYPLIVDAPSNERARQTLDLFFRPDMFGGDFVCPTISRSDPAFPDQGYWHGTIWGPTSYLTFQGLRRYATGAEMTDFAQKSVALFMRNWDRDGTCCENFNAITGRCWSDPHYTWGALLCLIGLEHLCDTGNDGKVILNGASGLNVVIHNLRIAGRIFDVRIEPQKATLFENGTTVATAIGEVAGVQI